MATTRTGSVVGLMMLDAVDALADILRGREVSPANVREVLAAAGVRHVTDDEVNAWVMLVLAEIHGRGA